MADFTIPPILPGSDNNATEDITTALDGASATTFTYAPFTQAWWNYAATDLTAQNVVGFRFEIDVAETTPGNTLYWRITADSPDYERSIWFTQTVEVDTPGAMVFELNLATLYFASPPVPTTDAELVATLVSWLVPGDNVRVSLTEASVENPGPIVVSEFRLIAYGGRNRPHLRQYPRSPLRKWPPERSVQRSLRQGPGAFK